ncbi:hypothetical protein IV203_007612 [Nitzschia inconspicua]|uniref:Uncharacterized protein n=1 Tax=Nitzschia inconspicua TaxID=303405 RepID=A0A9K3KFT1_9STRA|nr:hypothetical protein IV203_007612 [Nitzschia inconspicua]
MPPLAERLNVRHQQVERNRQAIDAVLQGFKVVASETRTLALPINHMVQSQLYYQGNVDTSASVMAACNAYANDYSKRMEHRRQALPQHQALLFPTTTTTMNTMGIPQQIADYISPRLELTRQSESSLLPPGFGHQLPNSPNTVMNMYNEWYGLEKFKDFPGAGGINAKALGDDHGHKHSRNIIQGLKQL